MPVAGIEWLAELFSVCLALFKTPEICININSCAYGRYKEDTEEDTI